MAKRKPVPLMVSRDGSIKYATDGSFIYAEKDGATVRLDLFAGRYYKLRPYNGVPVLEVDGLRMQLVRDFRTPLDYSREVVRALGIPRAGSFSVLDTCMGLGYTAIAAASLPSVSLVVTCEVSEAVVQLARWNPLSDPLFEKGGKITLLEGDVSQHILSLAPKMFDFVIHDPPRVSHAPELYSAGFYKELFRVCKSGARIFHYVGAVGTGRGRRIDREVSKRMAEAGFSGLKYVPRLQGILGRK